MQTASTPIYKVLTLEQKKVFVNALWTYHHVIVHNDLHAVYAEEFNIAPRSFKEQLSGRRVFKESQLDFVIDFLLSQTRTDERNARQIFRRVFQAEPETFGYLLTPPEPLPFDESMPISVLFKNRNRMTSETV